MTIAIILLVGAGFICITVAAFEVLGILATARWNELVDDFNRHNAYCDAIRNRGHHDHQRVQY